MNRSLAFAGAFVPCLFLAGCNWDSALGHADNYQAFAASKEFHDPLMPTALVPRSARAIEYKLVLDMNEATLDFDFAPADRARVLEGFEAIPPAVRTDMIERPWFQPRDPGDTVMRRCSGEGVEIISVGASGHAHYQSSQYPETRTSLCAGTAKAASPA